MSILAGSGPISIAEDLLRVTFADAAAVRTWMCVETQAQALGRIFIDALPPSKDGEKELSLSELKRYRPFIIINTAGTGGLRRRRTAVSAPNTVFNSAGQLEVRLEQELPATLVRDTHEAERRWKNTLGEIIDDVGALFGTAGYLDGNEIALIDGPYRNHQDDFEAEGMIQGARLTVTWGRD